MKMPLLLFFPANLHIHEGFQLLQSLDAKYLTQKVIISEIKLQAKYSPPVSPDIKVFVKSG